MRALISSRLATTRTKLQLVKATAKHPRDVQRKSVRIKSDLEREPVRYKGSFKFVKVGSIA